MLRRLWGVRHLRYWWFRVKLARHLAMCQRNGLGLFPHPSDIEYLDALWKGEK